MQKRVERRKNEAKLIIIRGQFITNGYNVRDRRIVYRNMRFLGLSIFIILINPSLR